MNGSNVEIVELFPFVLSLSKHERHLLETFHLGNLYGAEEESAFVRYESAGGSSLIAFPRFYATVCQHELSTGATRPCVFTCQDATGQKVEDFVVKFRSEVRGQETGLLFEFLAAQLAIRLGIPMPATSSY